MPARQRLISTATAALLLTVIAGEVALACGANCRDDRERAGVCGGGDSGADAERGVVPVVPGERVARDPANDADVDGAAPRARWRLLALHQLLAI